SMSDNKKQVSRRQFLNYSLTGLGGFMAAGILLPNLRFAIDPVLQKKSTTENFVNEKKNVDDISEKPERIDWEVEQLDGWYKSDVKRTARVFKDDNGDIQAFSPICKHLGCFVSWEANPEYPDQFISPCHNGPYYTHAPNVPHTPSLVPLDVYEQKIEDGILYLGDPIPREEA